jgi:hypothetical protein
VGWEEIQGSGDEDSRLARFEITDSSWDAFTIEEYVQIPRKQLEPHVKMAGFSA